MALYANMIIIVLEIIGLYLSFRHVRWQMIIYYTEISNFLALIASIVYLFNSERAVLLRYVSCCMLSLTFLISLFVLSPQQGGIKETMLSGECLYHHTLIPIISLVSYLLWEGHSYKWYVPMIISLSYGILMIYLNHLGKLKGPYDFFRIDKNGKKATAIWVAILILLISLISIGIIKLS